MLAEVLVVKMVVRAPVVGLTLTVTSTACFKFNGSKAQPSMKVSFALSNIPNGVLVSVTKGLLCELERIKGKAKWRTNGVDTDSVDDSRTGIVVSKGIA